MTSEMLMVLFVQDISGAWRCKSIGHTVAEFVRPWPGCGYARRIEAPTSTGQAEVTCAGGKWRATSTAPSGRTARTSRHSSRERCLDELQDLLNQRVTT